MKGITVRIDAALHAEIKAYLEQHEMTMGEFIALAAQDELHPKTPEVEVKEVGRMRTLAFQVEEELFQRVKQYLERNGMTQRQFVIGLIEDELDCDEEQLRKQQEDAEQSEGEQDEGISEDGEATVSEDGPDVEQVDEPEETAVVGDSEGSSDEPDEEETEQDFTDDELDYSESEDAEGPVEDEPDEHQDLAYEDLDTAESAREFVEGELGAAVEVSPMHEFDEDALPDFPEPDSEEYQDYGMNMGVSM
ncbi:hypothetical protein [Acutalibacter caecimuris]|uniref:hypothetical protein n=1 Tax=Acutalibacter caecimuris TaxID=3093657 RepID=UPI002AC9423B|nr:hypothetical protein [Acutalibacter sp. M00118]